MTRSLRVARNVSTTLITQAVTWLLAFAVIFFLPRYAGPTGFGEMALAGSVAGIFNLFSSLGISTVIMRDIPRDVANAGSLIGGSLFIRLPLAIVSIFLALAAGAILGYSHQVQLFIAISMLTLVVGVVSDTANSAVRGLERFSIANIGSLIDKCVGAAIVIIVCVLKGPLWMLVAAGLVSTILSATYMMRGIKLSDVKLSIPSKDELIVLAKSGLPFMSAGIFAAIYAKSDAIFLQKFSTTDNIGWYALAVRLSGTAMALPTTVCSAMLPPLSAMYKENIELFTDGAARLLNLMVICCVPIAAAMIFCAAPLVSMLSPGSSQFAPAAPVVEVYGVAVILYFMSQGAASAVIACDQEKIFGKAMSVAALFSIPLTALCIYITQRFSHNGAVGAAISDLLAELYLVTCYLISLPKGTVSWTLVKTAGRAISAAIPLIVEFYLVPSKFVLMGAVPCLGIYAYLCVRLGCLHPKDVQLLTTMVKGKFRSAS